MVWAEPAWRAWNDLTNERDYITIGFSSPMGGMMIQAKPCPIPWQPIQLWCDRHHFHGPDREFVEYMIKVMDREYIAHWAKQQNRPAPDQVENKLARWDAAED